MMSLSAVNPYGAVPAALKESRLALRDIMADYLNTKAQEANVNLMQKKAETDLAMVGANLERDRLTQEQQANRFQTEVDLRKADIGRHAFESDRSFKETQRQFDVNKRIQDRSFNLSKIQHADLIPGKAIDIMGQAYPNIPKAQRERILTAAGFDPNAVTTPQVLKQYQGLLLPVQRSLLQDDFKSTMAKAGQAADPKMKTQLLEQAGQIAMQAKNIDQFLTKKITPVEAGKLFKQLEAAGSIDPGTNFQDFYDEMTMMQEKSAEGINMIKEAQLARAKHAVDPNYDQKFLAYSNIIHTLDDPKHEEQIKRGIEKRADDPAAALEYIQGWARHLSSQKQKAKAAKS